MMIPRHEMPAYLLYDDRESIIEVDWLRAEGQAIDLVHQELKDPTSLPDLWDFYVGLLKDGNVAFVYNYLSHQLDFLRELDLGLRKRISDLRSGATEVESGKRDDLIARLEEMLARDSERQDIYARSFGVLTLVLDLYCIQGKRLKWHELSEDIRRAIVNADPPWRCDIETKFQLRRALVEAGIARFEVSGRIRWMSEQTKLIFLIRCLMDPDYGMIDTLGSEGAAWEFVERTFVGECVKESSFKRQWTKFTLPKQESRLSSYLELKDIVRKVCGEDNSEESSALSE